MSLRSIRISAAVFALAVATPAVADAQIYAWRDSAGNWVLSDKPKDPSAETRTYAIRKSPGFTTTKGVGPRAAQYDALIEHHATAQGVNPHLVRAVIQQESAFNPRALSHKGAMGLMQLMPATAAELGVADPYNPGENIRAGVTYLKGLLVRFAENIELALAAYNAGPTAVTKYGAVPPYRETRNYVTKITKAVDGAPKPVRIFKTVEIVNGRPVTRYSTVESQGAEYVTTGAAVTRPSAAAAPQK
jgi:soluble lytic murein transglycosylase-like protein